MPREFFYEKLLEYSMRVRSIHRLGFLLGVLCMPLGCDEDLRFFDRFPIQFDDSLGPMMMEASIPGFEKGPMVVDTLSPLTIFDPNPSIVFVESPKQIRSEFIVYEHSDVAASAPARLVYPKEPLISGHACGKSGSCLVGDNLNSKPFSSLLGADRLSLTSVRISFPKKQLQLFPDTVGSSSERIDTCDVAFRSPFQGGGVFRIDGTEIPYPAIRPAFTACLESCTSVQNSRGVDMQLLFSTAIGDTILTRTAYNKYAQYAGQMLFEDLPTTDAKVYTPSGALDAKLSTVEKMSLVNPVGEDRNARGPCLELAAHRQVTTLNTFEAMNGLPCPNGDSFCQIGPAVELFDSFDVYIVNDEEPLFQSLRDELRPNLAEIDGIIGTKTMQPLQIDLDYPNKRILFSCEDKSRCLVRAPIFEQNLVDEVQACLVGDAPTCPIP